MKKVDIIALAAELGYSVTQTATKAVIIQEFLEQQG